MRLGARWKISSQRLTGSASHASAVTKHEFEDEVLPRVASSTLRSGWTVRGGATFVSTVWSLDRVVRARSAFIRTGRASESESL